MATERGLESNIASDHGLVLAEGSRDPPAHPRVPIRPTLPHPHQSANTGVSATFITRARSEQKVNHFTTKLLSTNFQRKKHLWLITESKEVVLNTSHPFWRPSGFNFGASAFCFIHYRPTPVFRKLFY